MASLIFLFLVVIAISGVKRHRQVVRRLVQAGSFFVFYYVVYSCLGVFGMIRNGLYGMTLLGTAYSESFYWLALPVRDHFGHAATRNSVFALICPTEPCRILRVAAQALPAPARSDWTRGPSSSV